MMNVSEFTVGDYVHWDREAEPIVYIGWDARVRNALNTCGVRTWDDLRALSPNDLLKLKGFGRGSLAYLQGKMSEAGVSFSDGRPLAAPTWAARSTDVKAEEIRQRIRANHYASLSAPVVTGVYFVKVDAFVKIGHAADIGDRMRQLQTGSPFDLQLIAYVRTDSVKAAKRLEHELHRRFEAYQHRLEWYRLEPELVEYIATLTDGVQRI